MGPADGMGPANGGTGERREWDRRTAGAAKEEKEKLPGIRVIRKLATA